MIVNKVLNNSCVVSEDEGFNEVILMGSGIGFGIKKGDVVDESKIQKTFRLDSSVSSKFQNVIKEIPTEYILASAKVTSYIKEHMDVKINDSIYITLTDHIWTSAERIKKGDKFDNVLLTNVKSLYHKEFEVACEVVKILTETLGIRFDETEASFITLHIINAEMDSDMTYIHKITRVVSKISDYVRGVLETDGQVDEIAFDRFLVHCRFLIQKIVSGKLKKETVSNFIKSLIFKAELTGGKETELVNGIKDIIKQECNYEIGNDEKLYLCIHLARLENKTKSE